MRNRNCGEIRARAQRVENRFLERFAALHRRREQPQVEIEFGLVHRTAERPRQKLFQDRAGSGLGRDSRSRGGDQEPRTRPADPSRHNSAPASPLPDTSPRESARGTTSRRRCRSPRRPRYRPAACDANIHVKVEKIANRRRVLVSVQAARRRGTGHDTRRTGRAPQILLHPPGKRLALLQASGAPGGISPLYTRKQPWSMSPTARRKLAGSASLRDVETACRSLSCVARRRTSFAGIAGLPQRCSGARMAGQRPTPPSSNNPAWDLGNFIAGTLHPPIAGTGPKYSIYVITAGHSLLAAPWYLGCMISTNEPPDRAIRCRPVAPRDLCLSPRTSTASGWVNKPGPSRRTRRTWRFASR